MVEVTANRHVARVVAPALVLLVVLAALAILAAMNRPIQVVRVQADLTEAEQEQVRATIDGLLGQGMLTLDLDEVVATMRSLSWPRVVFARREWPDALILTLVKETFVARWGDAQALNGNGEIFSDVDMPGSLPRLKADRAGAQRAMQVFQMLQGVVAPVGVAITALDQDAAGEWRVELADGFRVALGRADLAGRLGRFLTVHRSVLAQRSAEVDWVDARYSNGIAVRWHQSASATELAKAH